MKLKVLTDSQYRNADLVKAYHIVYYVPKSYGKDITGWSDKIFNFKKSEEYKSDNELISLSVEAIKNEKLSFNYIIRVMGHEETIPKKGHKLSILAKEILKVTDSIYIVQLLRKKRRTIPFHLLNSVAEREAEIKDVFFVYDKSYDLNRKTLLIVDDITTSCTLVKEMIKTIKKTWPYVSVYQYCIGRTNHDIESNLTI